MGTTRRRECTGCGQSFSGSQHLCSRCRATDRACRDCGRNFRGIQNQCSACLQVQRACADCGARYQGTNRRCLSCRTVQRQCNHCGKAFTGHQASCPACLKLERTCTECGKAFRGHTLRCSACQVRDRICTECGAGFRGDERLCPACRPTERQCVDCGRTFRGVARRCGTCWKATLPAGVAENRARTYGNSRRARKLGAEVAGPLWPEEYYVIRWSGACVYCGSRDRITVDHVRALTRGGAEHWDNLVAACVSCNSSKGNRLLTEWRQDRVIHGAEHSPKVSAEYVRLTGHAPPLSAEAAYRMTPEYLQESMELLAEITSGWK